MKERSRIKSFSSLLISLRPFGVTFRHREGSRGVSQLARELQGTLAEPCAKVINSIQLSFRESYFGSIPPGRHFFPLQFLSINKF